MRPISFTCIENLSAAPGEIVSQILDPSYWPGFQGYGPLPGIREATLEVRTPEVVGTRFRVINTDGSSHLEEVVEWQPDRLLRLTMSDFSPPLSRLANRFIETWQFEPTQPGTQVSRTFELHCRSRLAWPALWLISLLLKKAVARHLRQLRHQLPKVAGP